MPTESTGTETLVAQVAEPPVRLPTLGGERPWPDAERGSNETPAEFLSRAGAQPVPPVADSTPATTAPLHSDAPKAADSARNPLVSDEELMAARAEVQGASGPAAVGLPSRNEPRPAGAAPESSGDGSAEASATAIPGPACRKPQFRIPSSGTHCHASALKQAADASEAAPRRGGIALLVRQVYRAADAVLDLVNRPFSWLTGEARSMLGWWAVATLAVALSSWLLLPLLLPNRDAITFLKEKRSAIDRSPAAEVAAGGGGSKHGSGGGHH